MARTFLALTAIFVLLSPLACGNGSTGNSSGGGGNGVGGNVTDCSSVMTNACFTNTDCSDSSDRCEVVGMKDDMSGTGSTEPVACCVAGARGTGKIGDPCKHETDCASGLCESDMNGTLLCSKECNTDADCNTDFPTCVDVSSTGFKGKFCGLPA